jgi:CubicO group peptidase (beta-lactamase class C family)
MSGTTPGRLDADMLAALHARIQREIDEGRSLAAQFAIGLHGEIVASSAFGTATDASRFVMFSATKTIVAMALLPHFEDGTLDLTTRVTELVPGFGANGKQDVTVLQLLTMQGGFPQAPIGPDRWGTSEGRRAQFAEWSLDWPAGTRTEYHPVSAHWVIAELLETLDARPYTDIVHERVTAPAGVGQVLGGDLVGTHEVRSIGAHPGDAAGLVDLFGRSDLVPVATIGPDALLSMNHPRVQAAAIPGGGGIARAVDVALIYQSFIDDPSPWQRDAVGTIRNVSINVSDGTPANRTIAGCVAGNDGYHLHRWFPDAPRAFGHHGAGGQICWVDPSSGLSFCFLHDTLHQDPRVDFERSRDLNALAIACRRR